MSSAMQIAIENTVSSLRYGIARFAISKPAIARMIGMLPPDADQQIPAHVPATLVRDVDIYNLPGAAEDVHLAWKQVQDANPDIFYTPHYGGHWVLARAELIAKAFPDWELYSSVNSIAIPLLPKSAPPMLPIASDPPAHKSYRHPITMALSPKEIQRYSEEARTLAIDLIEQLQPRGECEFMADFAGWLPITIFLRMVDLPMKDREQLMHITENIVRGETVQHRMRYAIQVFEYLDGWIRRRRRKPGKDLLSQIVHLKVGERPLTHAEALGECAQVLFGGLDTVAGTMGFIARFLASNPQHQRELRADPAKIPNAVEELVRRHSIPNIARCLTRDVEINGVNMRKGDQVMIPICLHGLDERAWPDSLKVDFSRKVTEHVAFGKGVHKCPGANLARVELKIFIEEWLKRISDFSIKPGTRPVTLPGQVMGIRELHLSWKPR